VATKLRLPDVHTDPFLIKLEIWSERDGKWNMEVAMELIMRALEIGKAPVGADGKRMTAAARNEWVHSRFDSEAFDEEMRENSRDRILKGTAAKKLAKTEARQLKESGVAEGSAAKPKKKRKPEAAFESQ
jgi:hypothetical protein